MFKGFDTWKCPFHGNTLEYHMVLYEVAAATMSTSTTTQTSKQEYASAWHMEPCRRLQKRQKYRKAKYVQRPVCFVNLQSSLHENVVFSVCVRIGNATYILHSSCGIPFPV